MLAGLASVKHSCGVPVDVTTKTTIHRPVEIVAAFAADPTNVPKWYVKIESVDWKTQPPLVVGSRIEFVARFLGRRLQYTYEVVEYEPAARLVMRTAEGPFRWKRLTPGPATPHPRP